MRPGPSWRNTRAPDPLTQAALTDEELAHVYGVLGRFFLKHTKAELSEEAQRRRIILFPVHTAARSPGASAARRPETFSRRWSTRNWARRCAIPAPRISSAGPHGNCGGARP